MKKIEIPASVEDSRKLINQMRKQMMALRFRSALEPGQKMDTSQYGKLKKDIARVKTALVKRSIGL